MEMKEKAMNLVTIIFVIFLINSGFFFLIVGPTDLMNLSNYFQVLTTVILGIALLLYGIAFLGVKVPEKICDQIATIGIILASVIIILVPLLNLFLK